MESEVLTARLKAFALMLKFGHDLFDAKDFSDAAARAVSDSRPLLNFRTASLLERQAGKAELAAQFARTEPNPYSRLAAAQKRLAESLKFNGEPLIVTKENGLPEELAANDGVYCCLLLPPPKNLEKPELELIWLLEYEKELPAGTENTAKLLAHSIGSALYYQKLCKTGRWQVKRRVKRGWIWLLLLLLAAGAMFLRVPEYTTAEFTLCAPEITGAYAWFDGPIAKCYRQDGDTVKKGELIAEYDTAQLRYRLSAARSQLREIEAELALEQQNAFTEQDKLGKVRLLQARCQTAQVAVDEAQWYLDHARITAPADGVLALTDRRSEQFAGKAVRMGDKLFEILGGRGMTAEIPVNERDSSILRKDLQATLFLYTAPETAIPVKILEIQQYPELTDQRTFCYKIRAELPGDTPGVRCGMRGVARLSAGEVSLGYRLFKNAVLFFRGL